MKSGSSLFALSLVTLLLVGCAGSPAPEEEDPGKEQEDEVAPWSVSFAAAGCPEAVGVVLMEPDALQAVLPDGFTVRDAGDFFDLGLPTGKAVLFFNGIECPDHRVSETAVYVEAPDVEGYSPADYDFYMLGHTTQNATHARELKGLGALVENATLDAVVDTVLPVVGEGRARVDGEERLRYSFEARGATPQPFELTARFWHVVPSGLVLWEYVIPENEAFVGTLRSCLFEEGSLHRELVGADCTGAQTAAILFPEQRFEATVAHLPDLEVA